MDQRANDAGEAIQRQTREWGAQRIGWAAMTLFVLAALLGLLGSSGPLAETSAGAIDGSLEITYTRLNHHHAPGQLSIQVDPAFVVDGEVRLWFDSHFVRQLGVQSILPEPEQVDLESGRLVYIFAVGEATGPLEIEIVYEHDGFWVQRGRIGIVDGAPVELRQFVFP